MAVLLDAGAPDFEARFRDLLAQKREAAEDVDIAVRAIIADVRARGDLALCDFTRKFDRFDVTPARLRITDAEINAAWNACDVQTLRALTFARDRIESHHARQKPEDDRYTDGLGVELGHRWTAVEAAGL